MRFSNAEFDRLYENAMQISEDSLRWKLYREMDKIIVREAPFIPLYYDRVLRILQKNISGMQTNPMNHLFLKTVEKQ